MSQVGLNQEAGGHYGSGAGHYGSSSGHYGNNPSTSPPGGGSYLQQHQMKQQQNQGGLLSAHNQYSSQPSASSHPSGGESGGLIGRRSGANAPQPLWVQSNFGDPDGTRREDSYSPSKGQLLEVRSDHPAI